MIYNLKDMLQDLVYVFWFSSFAILNYVMVKRLCISKEEIVQSAKKVFFHSVGIIGTTITVYNVLMYMYVLESYRYNNNRIEICLLLTLILFICDILYVHFYKYTNAYVYSIRIVDIYISLDVISIVAGIISIVCNFLKDFYNNRIWVFFLLLIEIFVMLFMVFMTYKNNRIAEKRQKELLEKTNKMIERNLEENKCVLDSWRKGQHDLKNYLIVIDGLLKIKEYDAANQYVVNLLQMNKISSYTYDTGNKIVNVLINYKNIIATEKKINFSVEGAIPKELNISNEDMAAIIGNSIDNCIEASEKTKEAHIYIEFITKEKMFIMKFINSVQENPLDKNPDMKTTKDGEHGIGIKNIQDAVKYNNGIMNYRYEDKKLILTIMFSI